MALAYLQQREESMAGALPVAGHLRKGEPKKKTVKNDREIEVMGRNLTWFRFASDDKRLEQRFNEVYADQIKLHGGAREIEFVVYGHKVKDVYNPRKEHHVGTRLMHRCDGVICERWWDDKTKAYSTEPKPCPGQCKYKIKMPIIIPALGVPAAINVHSSSFWDSLNLHNNLTAIYTMFETLMGVKMILRRSLHYINKPINGVPVRSPEWLLTITATEESFQKRLAQLQDKAFGSLLQSTSQLALNAGISENPSEWEEESEDDEGEALCSPETAAAIERLWPIAGYPRKGEIEVQSISEFLKKNKGVESLQHLDQESSKNLLELLQKRQLELEKTAAYHAKKAEEARPEIQKMDYICGNDLAAKILDAQDRVIQLGGSQDELDAEWTAHAGTLHTLDTCDRQTAEGWLDLLKQLADVYEAKK